VNGSFKEASYSGGGNITFKGTLEDNAFPTRRLFHGELPLGNLPIHFTYSVSYLLCVLKLPRSLYEA
jgi:mannosyl-glycoprotein endo-beta-N-acetylglucosaminidase